MTTIYQGWEPLCREIDERIRLANEVAAAAHSVSIMLDMASRNYRTGFYYRHPDQIALDQATLSERLDRLAAANAASTSYEAHSPSVEGDGEEIEITPDFPLFSPATPVQVVEREGYAENVSSQRLAIQGQSRPGWSG